MSDVFTLKGTYQVVHGATDTDPSADFDISSAFNETMNVKRKLGQTVSLDADGAETISLGDLAGCHVLLIRGSADVTVRVTTLLGAAQIIPAGKVLFMMNTTNPVTALTIQRQAGVSTTVRIVACELQP